MICFDDLECNAMGLPACQHKVCNTWIETYRRQLIKHDKYSGTQLESNTRVMDVIPVSYAGEIAPISYLLDIAILHKKAMKKLRNT